MTNGIFNFNFLPLVFSEILGGPKFTLGALRPLDATYRRNFFTKSEYFTIYIFFNFNILALVVSKILRGSQIYVRGLCAPVRPQRKNFCTRGQYFTMSDGVFNFNFLALVLSEILGGPKFTLGGPTPLDAPPSREIFVPDASTSQYLIVFLISTIQLQYFQGYQAFPNLRQARCTPPSGKRMYPRRVLYYA